MSHREAGISAPRGPMRSLHVTRTFASGRRGLTENVTGSASSRAAKMSNFT